MAPKTAAHALRLGPISSAHWRVQEQYEFEERGVIELKGGLSEKAYILKGRKLLTPQTPYAEIENGERPRLRPVS